MSGLTSWNFGSLRRARSAGTIVAVVIVGLLAVFFAWTGDQQTQRWITQRIAQRAVSVLDEQVLGHLDASDFQQARIASLTPTLDRQLAAARTADGQDLLQVSIYAPDGTVLYSGQQERVGRKVLPARVPRLAAALAGTVNTRVLSLSSADDGDLSGSYREVLAVYAPIRLGDRVVAASEIYADPRPIWLTRLGTWFAVIGPVTLGLLLYMRRRQSEQADQVEKLIGAAFFDALTGLANRSLFNFRLQQAFHRARRRGELMVVMFLDLDRFKQINDTLGHAAGDRLLVSVGERLLANVRPEDTIARLGGDEFAVILEEVPSLDEATRIAQRILDATRQPFVLAGQERIVHTSIGIAARTPLHQKPEDVVHDADMALYQAKEGGRDRYAIFSPQTRKPVGRAS
ncbi:MAG: GGDEF domain-containing protein [Chloroflexi bacterium]|nr:GGDEF domain-containing protein [Chloroflexota bacterium]